MRSAGWALVVVGLLGIAVAAPIKIVSKQVGSVGSSYGGGGVSANSTVHMEGLKFSPGALVVRKGTNVLFDNNDVAPHTVTEDTVGGVDSGVLAPGKSFRLVVANRLVYHCAIHTFMQATINLAG